MFCPGLVTPQYDTLAAAYTDWDYSNTTKSDYTWNTPNNIGSNVNARPRYALVLICSHRTTADIYADYVEIGGRVGVPISQYCYCGLGTNYMMHEAWLVDTEGLSSNEQVIINFNGDRYGAAWRIFEVVGGIVYDVDNARDVSSASPNTSTISLLTKAGCPNYITASVFAYTAADMTNQVSNVDDCPSEFGIFGAGNYRFGVYRAYTQPLDSPHDMTEDHGGSARGTILGVNFIKR